MTYIGHLKLLLEKSSDPVERAQIEEQFDLERHEAEFANAGLRERIEGELLLRERYGGPY